jgi:PPOX class probable F420-dependent enzyme
VFIAQDRRPLRLVSVQGAGWDGISTATGCLTIGFKRLVSLGERIAMVAVPDGYASLLERPLYGHLATVRPDGNPQVNPMWFDWDGELLRFTHTSKRQKFRNIEANPNVAMSISDPENPYRYLEVRGVVEDIVADPTGAFYLHLNDRYSGPLTEPPADKSDRVILVVRPTGFSKQ